ncbi:exosortase A [Janthinobacterium psychrotolerans]|uniref:Exosortase A n=1 Tax=Janthinobacterium psychrotolerans TaxID=1747903 RepID=A0A1A7BZ61_9BURK|nr:exosortase A [Janthinobacterium psychrotolerans]OBV37760.1 exosortase A [Janthinobacterium psychrotolerans]
MKLAERTVAASLPAPPAQAARATPGLGLRALLLAIAIIVPLYHATFWGMAEVWSRSQTFAHGFLIVPISLYLCWRQRARLAALPPRPSLAGLLLLLLLGVAWLLADLAYVQVAEQYAATAMLPAAVLAILGWPAMRVLAFPLAYLLLAVPFGEVFLPPLIDFTASFTVGALHLSGVPVFRDGNYFSLPTGNWSVVEACSGLRYVIASLALGALFAHLHFRSLGRRLAVMACALLVPILANGVRAWLIVMLGHHSNMRLAVGVDHLVYGWLFFGVVMLLLFLLASRWRERMPVLTLAASAPAAPPARTAPRAAIKAAAACVLIAGAWPALAWRSEEAAPLAGRPPAVLALSTPPGWRLVDHRTPDWSATLAGAPLRLDASYAQGAPQVSVQLAWYARQARNAELLTHQVTPYGARWLPLAQETRHLQLQGRSVQVHETVLAHGSERVLVWRSYQQGGVLTARPAVVKMLLAKGKLLGERQDGADIMVSSAYDELAPPPRARLQAYLQAALPAIEQALRELSHAP